MSNLTLKLKLHKRIQYLISAMYVQLEMTSLNLLHCGRRFFELLSCPSQMLVVDRLAVDRNDIIHARKCLKRIISREGGFNIVLSNS